MTSITTILGSDLISNSRTDINNNFAALNSGKVESSAVSTDNTLGGTSPSDSKIPTEKAINEFVVATASPTGKSWNEYAVANSGTDSYTISVPGVTAYVTGQTFKFKADVANTGTCSLNVNGLGAKIIKKLVTTDLATNDILINQGVVCTYDGTNMQMINALPQTYQNIFRSGTTTKDISSTSSTTIAHGLGVIPSKVTLSANLVLSNDTISNAYSTYTNSTQSSYYYATFISGTQATNGTDFRLIDRANFATWYTVGTVTVDATNITISWSKTGSPTGTANILWEAQY